MPPMPMDCGDWAARAASRAEGYHHVAAGRGSQSQARDATCRLQQHAINELMLPRLIQKGITNSPGVRA